MTTIEPPSNKLVMQRIRNRIIEVLELFADDGAYMLAVENLEFWGDWVDRERLNTFAPPVFTADELAELSKVNVAWEHVETCSSQDSKEWLALSQSSKQALKAFLTRGVLSESVENA